ncbi:DNA topoisomerase I [Chryseobacterium gallinarum]|uniref:DNA topoisomerase n=1 Tax=Chryseobacterium gallinarum TaxID=1324352 RepID=A0A0G3LWK4_CHRGL|nr:type IA DNA topoisomerase [Chryseobacterium gallinarum]AKK71346.1 DNA topoisomerase I [Chryseobacterium gallinarum]
MKAIIAEKPSVAYELARIVGAIERRDGYCEGGGFLVTWAYGHLVGLAMPEDYGIRGFSRESLPIIPQHFLLVGRKVKTKNSYIPDEGARRQLEVIKCVFNQCNRIIVATDAGREGEVIFRYIYEYLECDKPFDRLWISSLTEKAIIAGLDNLRDGSEFNGLYEAGRSRSQSDWLVGINATQALTVAMGDGLYSLGRVQTPTLAMICKRYLDHTAFQIKDYFQIELSHLKDGLVFKSLSVDKWEDSSRAESVLRSIERSGTSEVIGVETKSAPVQAPLLFDLTGLQKEANRKLGFTAERTLDIAQKLYERKFITYPRTGSKYVPEDVWLTVLALIISLSSRTSCKEAVEYLKWERYNKHIVNDVKVTDHHGILITENIPTTLDKDEDALYDMIARRLLEAVSPACQREITEVKISALHFDFIAKAIRITMPGWKLINGNFEEEDEDLTNDFPDLREGMPLKIESSIILAKKTKPPALYTEADLLTAMENVGNSMDTEKERKVLKNIGIGTPATRAAVIETLFDREYIRRVKKTIVPTEKGMVVYNTVKNKRIADAAMTAQWEMAFEKIELQEAEAGSFLLELNTMVAEITTELLQEKGPALQPVNLHCPKCRDKVFIREKVIKCSNDGCGWFLFRTICGVQLTYKDVEVLLTKKRSPLIKNMKGRNEKSFNAYILLDPSGSTTFEFERTKNRR